MTPTLPARVKFDGSLLVSHDENTAVGTFHNVAGRADYRPAIANALNSVNDLERLADSADSLNRALGDYLRCPDLKAREHLGAMREQFTSRLSVLKRERA